MNSPLKRIITNLIICNVLCLLSCTDNPTEPIDNPPFDILDYYEAVKWNGTWKVTQTENTQDDMPQLGETYTIKNTDYDGSIIKADIVWFKLDTGYIQGHLEFDPTGMTLSVDMPGDDLDQFFVEVTKTYYTITFKDPLDSNIYNFNKMQSVKSFDADLWIGTWKVIQTDNYSLRPQLNEIYTITNANFDGSFVTADIDWLSLRYGNKAGILKYDPTGQTLRVDLEHSSFDWCYVDVSIDATTLSVTEKIYNTWHVYSYIRKDKVTSYDADLWNGTWKVIQAENTRDDMPQLNETYTITNAHFGGSLISANIVWSSQSLGERFGILTFNPTGQILIIGVGIGSIINQYFGDVVINATTLTMKDPWNEYTFEKQ
ncbi:hypothetical protein ACFL6I_14340 [candidate division KSB1 bacterium]